MVKSVRAAGRGIVDTKATYSITELAELACISPRALRHYDSIGLLVPQRAENGYRVYVGHDVHTLQRIMMLRTCGVPLGTIAEVLQNPDFDLSMMLSDHLSNLRRQREALEKTIVTVERMVGGLEAFEKMDDKQRFEQLKQESVERFEEEYGADARECYGDVTIDQANERMLHMSKIAWDMKEELEQRIKDGLKAAMVTGDPRSEQSRLVAGMHAQWIRVHWGDEGFSPEAYRALADWYVADPRFVAYYDEACGEGATEFLRDIIKENIY